MSNKVLTEQDLIDEIKKEDPDFDPESVESGDHPWIKVTSRSFYPECEAITRGKQIEYKIHDTHVNLKWLLDQFNVTIRYNLMTRRREITIPDMYIFADDRDNDTLAKIEYLATLNLFPTKSIDRHLDALAGYDCYHPIVEQLEKHPWDGVARLSQFLSTIDSENPSLTGKIIQTWMVAAIASAHSKEGFTHHGVLVLQGPQGLGKTEWVKALDPIGCNAVRTGALLDPKSKDSVIGLSRFWIVELGELDGTFNKTDIAHLKSFITSDSDDVRAPYARKETRLARRTAYVATVNNTNFLVDDTGNRRWWTVSCRAINYNHGMDMLQVWAEVKALWLARHPAHLPNDLQDAVNEVNKEHERTDPMEEMLKSHYDWTIPDYRKREMTATDILIELGYSKPTTGEVMRLAKALKSINGMDARRSNGLRLHTIPLRLINK